MTSVVGLLHAMPNMETSLHYPNYICDITMKENKLYVSDTRFGKFLLDTDSKHGDVIKTPTGKLAKVILVN